jgi:hypothetical protein
MSGSLLLTPPVKRNRTSSALTAPEPQPQPQPQPHRTQHPGTIALTVRSTSSTIVSRELSALAVRSPPLYLPEPPCTPKDESRCSTRRTPPSLCSQFVSVWQSARHPDNSSNSPSSHHLSRPTSHLLSSPLSPRHPQTPFSHRLPISPKILRRKYT